MPTLAINQEITLHDIIIPTEVIFEIEGVFKQKGLGCGQRKRLAEGVELKYNFSVNDAAFGKPVLAAGMLS
jgi:hypothetical protein